MISRFSRARKSTPRHKPSLWVFRTRQIDADRERQPSRWRKFLSYYRPHLPLLLADLFCAILVAGTAIALPLCANYVTRYLLTLSDTPQAFGEILVIGAAMLAILVLQSVAIFFVDYQGHVMGARIEAAVRQELFEHCQKLSFSFHDTQRTGQLMSRITNDSLWLGELFHHGPEDLSIAVLKYGGAMVVLFYIDPPLAGIILLLTSPMIHCGWVSFSTMVPKTSPSPCSNMAGQWLSCSTSIRRWPASSFCLHRWPSPMRCISIDA